MDRALLGEPARELLTSNGRDHWRLIASRVSGASKHGGVPPRAWHYRHRASAGKAIKKRRNGQPEAVVSIAERADQRLNRKFRRMVDRYNKKPAIAAVSVARELAGFIWAIGQIQD